MKDTRKAADGHEFSVYVAQPEGQPRGALVVVQEIFGVNDHIRAVADAYAAAGYLAIAPALFDRVRTGYEAGYSQPEVTAGVEIMKQLNFDDALLDVKAVLDSVPAGTKAGIVGYCYGGTVAWLAACRLPSLGAAVCYYGGGIPNFANEAPQCATMLHFGNQDQSLPVDKARLVAKQHPQVISHFYEAGHGFNCDQRGSYEPDSAKLAFDRTREFLGQHLSAA
ncbi:dienelactone hydrolase family protein [Bordetella petrii]|nr:dienelactone hydrolase family protein [Bordetella petrii]